MKVQKPLTPLNRWIFEGSHLRPSFGKSEILRWGAVPIQICYERQQLFNSYHGKYAFILQCQRCMYWHLISCSIFRLFMMNSYWLNGEKPFKPSMLLKKKKGSTTKSKYFLIVSMFLCKSYNMWRRLCLYYQFSQLLGIIIHYHLNINQSLNASTSQVWGANSLLIISWYKNVVFIQFAFKHGFLMGTLAWGT